TFRRDNAIRLVVHGPELDTHWGTGVAACARLPPRSGYECGRRGHRRAHAAAAHLTSWTEDGLGTSVRRAWKGSPFETLDALEAKGFLTQGGRAKSVYVTDAGTTRAAELRKKDLG